MQANPRRWSSQADRSENEGQVRLDKCSLCTPHSFMLQGPTNCASLSASHDAALCKLESR